MIRRNSIIALAMVALAFASMSFAEAGGSRGGGKGRPAAPPAPPATTRTIVNNTTTPLYTYIYSGTGAYAKTVAEANAQGAKVVNPNGGRGVFNVVPNAGGNQFGDEVKVISTAAPGFVLTGTSSINPQEYSWSVLDYQHDQYPRVPQGQNVTITVTAPSISLVFTPPGRGG